MKRFLQLFENLFQGLVGKLFVIVNFVICLLFFDWHKFFRYLETPARFNCHLKPNSPGIDICMYGGIEPLILLFGAIYLIFVYPSITVTEIIIEAGKTAFPLSCLETFDVIYIPIFSLVNAFYWLFLGDMIEMAHSAYLRNKRIQKPLSCFPDSK